VKFQIQDEKAKAVLKELATRLGVSEETIINAAMKELVKQYVQDRRWRPCMLKQYLNNRG